MNIEDSKVEIDRDGTERISPEIVLELDAIFADMPGVDTVALAALLLKLTGRAHPSDAQAPA